MVLEHKQQAVKKTFIFFTSYGGKGSIANKARQLKNKRYLRVNKGSKKYD
jgi:hypothetical protein